MIITEVTLENFRQYHGKQSIKFSTTPNKHVTIIEGAMGAGKSNLFKAINWCLYEKIDDEEEIINKFALENALPKDVVTTKVTINFKHNGKKYVWERALSAKNIEKIKEKGQFKFKYNSESRAFFGEFGPTGETKFIDHPETLINQILPEKMRTHFFFDGERIDQYTAPGHEREVKEGIRDMLQLEAMTRAINHLDDIATEFNKEQNKIATGELKSLIDGITTTKDELGKKGEELDNITKERDSAKKINSEITEKLKKLENIKDLVEERQRLEKENENLTRDLENIDKEIKKNTNDSFFILGTPIFKKAEGIIEKIREQGKIPSGIRQQFITDLLNMHKCVCGRPIEPESPEEKALLNQLESIVPEDTQDKVMSLGGWLKNIPDITKNIQKNINSLKMGKESILSSIENNEIRKKEISNKIGEREEEDIQRLEKKRVEKESEIEEFNKKIGEINKTIKDLESSIQNLETEKKNAEIKEEKVKKLNERWILASDAKKAIEKVYERFASEKRKEIEKLTKQIFDALVWKNSQFRDVLISPSYELEVLDRYGTPARREFSAGERQLLSLAFILAMAKATGAEAPFIMDTPFARISMDPLLNIMTELPKLTDQLILLVTDRELTEEGKHRLMPVVGAQYRLVWDDKTGNTRI